MVKLSADCRVNQHLNLSERGCLSLSERYRYALILDKNDKFVAIFPPEVISKRSLQMINILNSGPSMSTAEARSQLKDIFKEGPTLYIQSDWSVKKALISPVWSPWLHESMKVAVTDQTQVFIGITRRDWLINSILG